MSGRLLHLLGLRRRWFGGRAQQLRPQHLGLGSVRVRCGLWGVCGLLLLGFPGGSTLGRLWLRLLLGLLLPRLLLGTDLTVASAFLDLLLGAGRRCRLCGHLCLLVVNLLGSLLFPCLHMTPLLGNTVGNVLCGDRDVLLGVVQCGLEVIELPGGEHLVQQPQRTGRLFLAGRGLCGLLSLPSSLGSARSPFSSVVASIAHVKIALVSGTENVTVAGRG